MKNITTQRIERRKRRVSANIFGTADRPRISVFRSNTHIYAQAIDDAKKITLCSASSSKLQSKDKHLSKGDMATLVGKDLGERMNKLKIKKALFDRGRYAYNGRIKALAEGLRSAEIQV